MAEHPYRHLDRQNAIGSMRLYRVRPVTLDGRKGDWVLSNTVTVGDATPEGIVTEDQLGMLLGEVLVDSVDDGTDSTNTYRDYSDPENPTDRQVVYPSTPTNDLLTDSIVPGRLTPRLPQDRLLPSDLNDLISRFDRDQLTARIRPSAITTSIAAALAGLNLGSVLSDISITGNVLTATRRDLSNPTAAATTFTLQLPTGAPTELPLMSSPRTDFVQQVIRVNYWITSTGGITGPADTTISFAGARSSSNRNIRPTGQFVIGSNIYVMVTVVDTTATPIRKIVFMEVNPTTLASSIVNETLSYNDFFAPIAGATDGTDIYVVRGTTTNPDLWRISTSGVATRVKQRILDPIRAEGGHRITAMGSVDGNLYGFNKQADNQGILYSINKSTGAIAVLDRNVFNGAGLSGNPLPTYLFEMDGKLAFENDGNYATIPVSSPYTAELVASEFDDGTGQVRPSGQAVPFGGNNNIRPIVLPDGDIVQFGWSTSIILGGDNLNVPIQFYANPLVVRVFNLPRPTSLSRTAQSFTQMEVSWTKVRGATGYQLRYKKTTDPDSMYVTVNLSGVDNNHRILTNLEVNSSYNVGVRASLLGSFSAWTNGTFSPNTLQGASGLMAGDSTPDTQDLDWDDAAGATGYDVDIEEVPDDE